VIALESCPLWDLNSRFYIKQWIKGLQGEGEFSLAFFYRAKIKGVKAGWYFGL
jgi:hypothetical protein